MLITADAFADAVSMLMLLLLLIIDKSTTIILSINEGYRITNCGNELLTLHSMPFVPFKLP